ncbi:MAG: hypothetical protein IJ629_01415 [Clostridia bacterium]|nr:hypothetical protein [Clostridia bacterium]
MKKQILPKIILVLILLIIVILLAIWRIKIAINQREIKEAIHGVVIAKELAFYKEPKQTNVKQIKVLKKSENVYILDEFEKDGISWYKVKVDGKTNGYVYSDGVDYYKEVNGEKVLVVDVSKYDFEKDFQTKEDFEVFVLENKVSGVYIRAGGRGYGEQGNFYEDDKYPEYVEACEYLKMPYGFYFLDEALNDAEIKEEVKVIKDFLKKAGGEYCVLPLALDVEDHEGKGRADDIWTSRAEIVQKLVDSLAKEKIETILYTNAQTANLYLSDMDTKFWIAYYPKLTTIPNYWYFETKQDGASNTVLNKKTIGWQFTENGIRNKIISEVDLSLFKSSFFQ